MTVLLGKNVSCCINMKIIVCIAVWEFIRCYHKLYCLTLLLPAGFPATIPTVTAWLWWEIQMTSACAEDRYC